MEIEVVFNIIFSGGRKSSVDAMAVEGRPRSRAIEATR
jgi:hypothetical protein